MMDSISLHSMRAELEKLATEGHGAPPVHQYEELNKPRAMQALKDIPVALLGTGLGYGIGRTGAEYLLPQVFQSAGAQETLKKGLPLATAAAGGLGAYFLSQQQRLMQKRRDEADAASKKKELGGTAPIIDAAQQTTPANAPVPSKLGGAIVPAVGARRTDPWREDTRYPKFTG